MPTKRSAVPYQNNRRRRPAALHINKRHSRRGRIGAPAVLWNIRSVVIFRASYFSARSEPQAKRVVNTIPQLIQSCGVSRWSDEFPGWRKAAEARRPPHKQKTHTGRGWYFLLAAKGLRSESAALLTAGSERRPDFYFSRAFAGRISMRAGGRGQLARCRATSSRHIPASRDHCSAPAFSLKKNRARTVETTITAVFTAATILTGPMVTASM